MEVKSTNLQLDAVILEYRVGWPAILTDDDSGQIFSNNFEVTKILAHVSWLFLFPQSLLYLHLKCRIRLLSQVPISSQFVHLSFLWLLSENEQNHLIHFTSTLRQITLHRRALVLWLLPHGNIHLKNKNEIRLAIVTKISWKTTQMQKDFQGKWAIVWCAEPYHSQFTRTAWRAFADANPVV